MSRYFNEQKTIEWAIEQAKKESECCGAPTPCIFDNRYIDMYGNFDGNCGLAFPCGCLVFFIIGFDDGGMIIERNRPDEKCKEHEEVSKDENIRVRPKKA